MYFVALITWKYQERLKSDLLEMIAMSSGTSKLFLQTYTSYCSSTRTPEITFVCSTYVYVYTSVCLSVFVSAPKGIHVNGPYMTS